MVHSNFLYEVSIAWLHGGSSRMSSPASHLPPNPNRKAANGYCFNTHILLDFHLQTPTIMSELRQRPTATASASNHTPETPPRTQPSHNEADDLHGVTVLDIIRVLTTFVLATLGLSYYMTNSESFLFGYRPWYTRWPVVKAYLVSQRQLPRVRLLPELIISSFGN